MVGQRGFWATRVAAVTLMVTGVAGCQDPSGRRGAPVGAPGDDDKGSASGSAYMFQRSGTTWTFQVKLTASDGKASHLFGESAALSGTTAVAGSQGQATKGTNAGATYIFALASASTTCTSSASCSSGHCVDGHCCD